MAAASEKLVIVADEPKLVPHLGGTCAVPIEVVPFGWETTAEKLSRLGAAPALRKGPTGEAFHTDGGNLILDCRFGPISDPAGLERALSATIGVVETGLFVGMTSLALVATGRGIIRLERDAPTTP